MTVTRRYTSVQQFTAHKHNLTHTLAAATSPATTHGPTCCLYQDVVKLALMAPVSSQQCLQGLDELGLDAAAQAAIGQLNPLRHRLTATLAAQHSTQGNAAQRSVSKQQQVRHMTEGVHVGIDKAACLAA